MKKKRSTMQLQVFNIVIKVHEDQTTIKATNDLKVQKLQFIKFKKESESTKLPILSNQQDQLQNHVCLHCT